MQQRSQPTQESATRRILVGYLGLYPTLLLVLTLLAPVTHDLSFPLMVLVEVAILVPVTQLVSFPLIRWLLSRFTRA
jgi:antibiotic biosynthesis monooxygenase (ABM) superfamily enzyme